MRLTPTERDRLLIFTAAELARARRARGLRLNVPESVALIADTVCEAARDGARLAEAIEAGRTVLSARDVLPGVAEIVTEVQVEAVFEDGTRLAVIDSPIGPGTAADDAVRVAAGDVAGSDRAEGALQPAGGPPGSILPRDESQYPVDTPKGLVELEVVNTASVPVSVTSHFHFFEANPRLRFDRAAAYGRHLSVPAGSSVRFDPGATVHVALVPIGGARVAIGFAGLVDGPLDAPGAKQEALVRAAACGYLGAEPEQAEKAGTSSPDSAPHSPSSSDAPEELR
jgi:urease subunit gamma/beta